MHGDHQEGGRAAAVKIPRRDTAAVLARKDSWELPG